jgi:hypothetical protein
MSELHKKTLSFHYWKSIHFGVMDILCVLLEMLMNILLNNIYNNKDKLFKFILKAKDF